MIRVLGIFLVAAALGLGWVYRFEAKNWARAQKSAFEHWRFVRALDVSALPETFVIADDGVKLATDAYLPRIDGPVPAILIRLPYGKRRYSEVRDWMRVFLPEGYAVVVQDARGRYRSGGTYRLYAHDAGDSLATMDWITAQPWSDGGIGTIGCSALGETQIVAAARAHPAHKAMIALGASGAMATLNGRDNAFGFTEGGAVRLASAFGWFAGAGGKTGAAMRAPVIDHAAGLRHLPVIDAVRSQRIDLTDFDEFVQRFDDPAYLDETGFVPEDTAFSIPFLIVDNWYDGAGEALETAELMRRNGAQGSAVIGPGLHCDLTGAFDLGHVGDLPVSGEPIDFPTMFLDFMDQRLKDEPATDMPPVLYYALGEDEWRSAQAWPPENAADLAMYLGPSGLGTRVPETGQLGWISDPADPVPAIGGNICCTGDPDLRAGPLDQRPIEARADVLVLTGPKLETPLRLAGPVEARLFVSMDVPDADIVARITDVAPDGRSRLIQEGALRLRYREGLFNPVPMRPGEVAEIGVRIGDIAYRLKAGHRLRLHLAGSNFPRLSRNLQTGGEPAFETRPRAGRITIHTGPQKPSRLVLTRLAD